MLGSAVNNYWLTWFPGAVLALISVLILVWKGITWLTSGIHTIKQVQVALPLIQAEFSPNHGSSMKDRMEALHDKQDRHAEIMGEHMANDRTAFARQDRFNNKIEGALERIEDKLGG